MSPIVSFFVTYFKRICISVRVKVHIMTKEQQKKTEQLVKQVKETYGENTQVNIFNGRPKHRGPDFTMIFQTITYAFTINSSPATCKMLLYFLTKSEWNNVVSCNIETIAEDLKMSKRTVLRSVQELKKENIIVSIQDDDDHRRNVYIMNPYQSWKGELITRKKYLKQDKEQRNQLALKFDE